MDAAPLAPANQEMQIDRAHLSGILDAADIGVFSGAWPSGDVICSAACHAHFRTDIGTLAAFSDILARLHPEDREPLQQALAQSLHAGEDSQMDCRLLPSGQPHGWVRLVWRVRRNARGEPCGWDAVTRDRSHTKQAEAERDDARQEADRRAEALGKIYEREHRIAEALQRSLLIKPSLNLGGLEVETVYQAAWDEALVGGDYYDVFALEEGRVALVVGDVSGKGLEAASRTAEIKFTLRAYLREYPHAATAMERLNAFLCESRALEASPSDYFVCLTLAVINPLTGEIDICSAGAEPALLLRADGEILVLQEGGLPLGVAAKAEYASLTVTQHIGDLLLIVTDGLTEARQGTQYLGEQGVAALARRSLGMDSLAATGQAILEGAQAFAGGHLHDDACLLLARRTA